MTNRKHNHYFLDVSHLDVVDVYRLCDLAKMGDDSGAKHHAIKKILFSGKRGAKDERKDIQEAIDTLKRKLDMMDEDEQRYHINLLNTKQAGAYAELHTIGKEEPDLVEVPADEPPKD